MAWSEFVGSIVAWNSSLFCSNICEVSWKWVFVFVLVFVCVSIISVVSFELLLSVIFRLKFGGVVDAMLLFESLIWLMTDKGMIGSGEGGVFDMMLLGELLANGFHSSMAKSCVKSSGKDGSTFVMPMYS